MISLLNKINLNITSTFILHINLLFIITYTDIQLVFKIKSYYIYS